MTVHAIQVSDSLANGNTSLRLRGASAFELSLNVIQVAGSAMLSSANNNGVLPLFRAIGICVLASLFQQGASSTRTSVIRMATDSSSQLSVVENTISAWANFTLESPTSATVSGLPKQIVSAIYLGLEHGGVASTTFVVCATVRSQSRLTIAQNVISITSVNVNIAAIALFKGVRMLVDSASIVGITKNMLRNISGLTTISSVISSSFFPALAVIGVLVIDGSNLLAPFLAAPPYSGSFTATVLGTGGQHQILNGSLVVIANNAITFFVSRPQAVAGRAAPIVVIGVAWCMGSIGTLVVASQSWWTVTLNTIVLLNVGNATALAELIDGSGVNTLTAMRVVIVTKDMGVGALLLLNVSTCEVSDNALTVPAANDTALAFSVSLMAVQLYSVNTQIEGGAPATLLINGTNSAMTLSRNIILVRSVDQVKSFSGAIVVTSGIVLSVTNAAGIAVAIVGTSSIALDWNDGVGDGSRGRSILVSSGGPLSNAVRISKGFVMVTMTSDFATATAASVLLPYLSALADPILKSTVVLSGGATFSVQSSAAFVVSQLFLSISLTNSATQDKGAVLCLQDSSSFLIEGNEVDKVVSGDAIVLTLAFLLLQNNVSTVGMSFNVLGSSTVSVSRNIVRTEGDISSPLNLQRGIVVSAVGYSWTHVEPNCHEVTPSPPPPDHGHARTFMSAFDGSAPIPTPVPTECSPISTNYKLLPLNAFTMYSQLTLSSNVVTTIDVAIWVSLGRVLLMNTSSMLTIQLNVLQSSSGTAVLSAGTAASISAQNYYAVSCVVTCDQGAIVLVERNTLVMQQRPPATFRSYLVFSGTWSFLSNTSIFMIIRRNAGICLTTSRINQLMLFDSFTSVNISLTLLMGACDRVNGHTLTTAADYVRAGAPQPGLLRVINCTTFSSSEYLNTTETKSVVASASVSVAQSETLSETMVPLRHAPSPTRLDTISSDISQSVCITASATLTPSRTRFTNESSPTVGLNATATPSPSKMSLSLRASRVREHAAWRGGTLSLTYTPTNSRSTTVSRMPLGTSSPTLSFSGSCAPSDDLAVVAPLFPMFQLLADVRETEDFTPLLPSRGVLPGVWASPLDSLVFSRVVATPPIAASAESESTTLRVILCRRPVSYPTPTVVPAASLTSVFGNGTVVIANSSMSLFTVHQWMSADQTFLSGDILEVRFLVEDWFNAAMDRRSARFNALPCRPQDSIVLAYVQLGGVLSSGQTAVQTTVGAVSTFTMIVSLLVGDGGNELQTMVLASMMECTPRGGSVQKSLGNLRSLAPLLLEESYLGVILGNLLLIGCVLGVQCVVMAVLALSRCAKNQPLRFGWATSGNEPSTNDAEVQSMEYSNDENTMAENHSRLLLQDDDEERAGLQAEDLLLPELPIPAPLTDPAATVLWEEENVASTAIGVAIDDSTQTKQKKDVSGRDDDVCDTSPEMQKRNGFPLADPPMSILSSVLFPGALFSVVAFTFQGTLFSGIRLVQLYRPGGTAVDSDSTRVAIGIVTMIILLPLPFGLVYFMHDRMHRSYHRYLVPLRRSGDRLSCLHRLFSVVPGAECGGVMLPRGVERVWGPFVSNCRPNRVWCVLPFASGWLMCVATVAQFFTSPIFCTAILVIVGVSNVALSCFIVWLRPRLSPLLNVFLVVQLCNNTAALMVNAVSIHLPVSSTVTIVIGLLQSALSVATTFATVASALTNIFQERREGLLGLEWHIGPLCSEAKAVNAATDTVVASLADKRRLVARAILRYRTVYSSDGGQQRLIDDMLERQGHDASSLKPYINLIDDDISGFGDDDGPLRMHEDGAAVDLEIHLVNEIPAESPDSKAGILFSKSPDDAEPDALFFLPQMKQQHDTHDVLRELGIAI